MSRPTIKNPSAPVEQETIRALVLGEDVLLLGCQLAPRIDGDDLVIGLILVGGKQSPIVGGLVPRAFPAQEIARIPLVAVRRGLGGAAGPQESLEAATEPDISPATRPDEPAAVAPDTSSPLILGGSIGG